MAANLMAETKRSGLAARIPQDVLARANKAGVHDVDWYAGRLEQTNGLHIASAESGTIDARHRQAVKHYRDHRGGNRQSLIVRFAALWARAVRRTPRRVG
jgi:hypothetical protein